MGGAPKPVGPALLVIFGNGFFLICSRAGSGPCLSAPVAGDRGHATTLLATTSWLPDVEMNAALPWQLFRRPTLALVTSCDQT